MIEAFYHFMSVYDMYLIIFLIAFTMWYITLLILVDQTMSIQDAVAELKQLNTISYDDYTPDNNRPTDKNSSEGEM